MPPPPPQRLQPSPRRSDPIQKRAPVQYHWELRRRLASVGYPSQAGATHVYICACGYYLFNRRCDCMDTLDIDKLVEGLGHDLDKLVEDLARQTKELPRAAIEGALADAERQSIERAFADMARRQYTEVGRGFKSLKSHNKALKKANTALSQENERLSQVNERLSQVNEQLARELRKGQFRQDSLERSGFIPVKDTLRPGHRTWHYIQ